MVKRGEIWWGELRVPAGSEPGYRRPLLIIQADDFNQSKIGTVIAVPLTTNLALGILPGNVRIAKGTVGVTKASVFNVSQIVTINKSYLTTKIGTLPPAMIQDVESGVRLVLDI